MAAEAWITGEPGNQKINFRLPTGGKGDKGDKGDKGLDGSNVLPTETAIRQAIETDGSLVDRVLKSTYVSGLVAGRGTGYDPTGTADSTPAFAAVLSTAATFGAAVSVLPGVYRIDSLTLGPLRRLIGLGGNTTRFGSTGITKPLVIFKHQTSSTKPMFVIDGGGIGLENIEMQGNYSAAPLLHVENGFESVLRNVRMIGVDGTALIVKRANNTKWYDVMVDNCGSTTAAAVVIKSPTLAEGNETNTFDIYGLTVERCKNVAIDIAYGGTRENGFYAEFLRFTNLHVESANDNGGVANVDPLIRVGDVRSLHFINPFIYGGGGYLIEHASSNTQTARLREGVFIIGGSLLGQEDNSSSHLVHLTTGNDFAMVGTRVGRFNTSAIKVEATYGPKVAIDPTSSLDGLTNVWLTDARAGGGAAWDWPGAITARSVVASTSATIGGNTVANPALTINGAAGTARRATLSSAGLARWFIQASATAEGGSNSGSDLEIVARADTGGSLGNVLSINRRTRIVGVDVGLQLPGKAGAPTDADFATTPPDRTSVVDTTNNRLYTRLGGVWRYVQYV